MAKDINTINDIKYVKGGTGLMTAHHEFQVNQGEHPAFMDIEVRNNSLENGIALHGNIPYDAYYEAMTELVTQYPAPPVE